MKRHVAGRNGEIMCRYSSINQIRPRAAALPAVRMAVRAGAVAVTGPVPPPGAPVADRGAILLPTAPTMPSDSRAGPGSPSGRIRQAHPGLSGPRAAVAATPGGVRPPNPRTCRRSIRPEELSPPHRRPGAGRGRRHRAAPHERRASPSRRTPLTASCGCVPEAPPKNPTLRSGRKRAASLTAPARHNRAAGAGAHAQPEAMHAGSAPVIRLEGPLALGHDVLLVVSRISIRPARRLARFVCGSVEGNLAAGRRGPQADLGRSRIADFRATV